MTIQDEIQQLTEALKHTKSTRMFKRYLAVRLHLEGRTLSEISEILGRSFPVVSGYYKSYQTQGLEGLDFKKYPGGIRKLSTAQEEQLQQTISEKKPADVGFENKFTWTLQLISAWIQREFDQRYTLKGVSKLLHRLGFSYTKASYTLAKADPKEQQ